MIALGFPCVIVGSLVTIGKCRRALFNFFMKREETKYKSGGPQHTHTDAPFREINYTPQTFTQPNY